jgi:endonuclease/exonuclease/phosphatase family metal-dependent hydrolase
VSRAIFLLLLTASLAAAADIPPVRIVAANLTSGNHQTYSPDNGNHSNIEGAGARILKALAPDIVLIQEFNTTIPVRQWVNATFGESFMFVQEPGGGIPNGIISRFPILESGEWDDVKLDNRDFVWAKIALPDGSKLWAVSVHLYAQNPATRTDQARALVNLLKSRVRPGDRIVVGGDLNTRNLAEQCLAEFSRLVAVPDDLPADQFGNQNTNAPRNKPYDWILVDPVTNASCRPVRLGTQSFANGFIFDSRLFEPSSLPPPVQSADSAVPGMQHMAVIRDFSISK